MKHLNLETIERYDAAKFYRTEIFKDARVRTLLLTLLPGQSVPSHKHAGCTVMLQALRGAAEITLDGETFTLRAGEIVFADGANSFAPANRGTENFAMLVTLVSR